MQAPGSGCRKEFNPKDDLIPQVMNYGQTEFDRLPKLVRNQYKKTILYQFMSTRLKSLAQRNIIYNTGSLE